MRTRYTKNRTNIITRCGAAGSARALGARCRRFESCHLDHPLAFGKGFIFLYLFIFSLIWLKKVNIINKKLPPLKQKKAKTARAMSPDPDADYEEEEDPDGDEGNDYGVTEQEENEEETSN